MLRLNSFKKLISLQTNNQTTYTNIEHYDSSINGYAIAEFTPAQMRWEVYAINKSDYDITDDGRNISKKGVSKHLAKSMNIIQIPSRWMINIPTN